MPELPEVEVCRQGISPHITNQQVKEVVVRHWQLRWPISENITDIRGHTVLSVERRAKYLLIRFEHGTLLLHLGMSGTIRVLEQGCAVNKHDHLDVVFTNGKILRLNDPRRFGAALWLTTQQESDKLLAKLGPEPLTDEFNQAHFAVKAKGRKVPIKTFIMNNNIVVGVGNIYANEALFLAGVRPTTLAGNITEQQIARLVQAIKQVLSQAIKQGGTTLKDFTQADGKPGYFAQQLNVYGRAGQPCVKCNTVLDEIRQANRSTVFCKNCQTEEG